MDLLLEDLGMADLTTIGLGIGAKKGRIIFSAKNKELILSGCEEAEKIFKQCGLVSVFYKKNGEKVLAQEKIAECGGDAQALHKVWKISQNIFEYCSGIATYTNQMIQSAQKINPHIEIATTRKNFPGAKKLMIQSVLDGGGAIHRMGLYDSILIFKQHLVFLTDEIELKRSVQQLQRRFIEKKIAVEVESFEEASYFAALGVDILQCEKMDFETLQKCVTLKQHNPKLLLSATGGITIENIEAYAKTGVDFIVTSSPYHAKPVDVKVEMRS